MALNDIYAVKLRFLLGSSGKLVAPGVHFVQASIATPDVETVAENVVGFWDAIKANFSADTALTAVTLRRVEPLEPLEHISTTDMPDPGTGTAATDLAPGTAIVVSWRTGFIGKSYRGRTYLPAPAEAVSDGDLTALAAQAIADAADDLITAMAADDMPLVVYSRNPLIGGTEVESVLVDQRLRSQRRRQTRVPNYVSG